MTLNELLENIQSDSAQTRTTAWQQAGSIGAAAVEPLAGLCAQTHQEKARAARRGLEKIVRRVGAPGSGPRKSSVIRELLGLLGDDRAVALRRDVLWLLSEIGGDESVPQIAALLNQDDLREDARMALERIPGDASLAALREALDAGPKDFRPNIAQSLRARGEAVDPKAYPCQKLVPTK